MHNSEWSLVFFTLLGQFSAGLVFCLLIFRVLGLHREINNTDKILRTGIYIAAASMIIALVISFLHLSAPLSSVYAFSNLKQSWLSREILMVPLFTAFLGFLSLYVYRSVTPAKHMTFLLLLATLNGFLMVYSMARIYMLPTIPAWDTPVTLINFFASGLLTGSAFFHVIFYQKTAEISEKTIQANAGKIYITIIGLALVARAVVFFLSGNAKIEDPIAFAPSSVQSAEHIVAWALWLAGLGLLLWRVWNPSKNIKSFLNFYYLAFLCFVLAEILYRALFYSSFYRIGI
jgi:anaerobic dimethyl sulfoxide reductase subunit C (anchor subunit)